MGDVAEFERKEGVMKTGRREFLAMGIGAAAVSMAAGADAIAYDALKHYKSVNPKLPVEENLLNVYLKPAPISLSVGAEKPFNAVHFSDTHLSMADVADVLSFGSPDLRLFERRNNDQYDRGGFPFSVQTLADTIAYARMKNRLLLNTGDLFDFNSKANVACVARAFAGQNILSALGNHESRGLHTAGHNPRTVQEDDALRAEFEKAYGHSVLVSSRIVNGVNFVAFDNCGLSRHHREEQYDLVKAEFAKGLPTVLLCHMPPFMEELHDAVCERRKLKKRSMPDPGNMNSYYMMTKDALKTKASRSMLKLMDMIRGQGNLRAILCGHLHFQWRGLLDGKVSVVVAGRNAGGECYDISFS